MNEEDPSQTGEPTATEVLRKRNDDSRMDVDKDMEDPNTMKLREEEKSQPTPLISGGDDEVIHPSTVNLREEAEVPEPTQTGKGRRKRRKAKSNLSTSEKPVGTEVSRERNDDSRMDAEKKEEAAKTMKLREEEKSQPTPLVSGGEGEAIQTPAVYSQEVQKLQKFSRKQKPEWRRIVEQTKVPQTEEAVGTKEVLQQGSKMNAGRKVGGAKPMRWGDEEEEEEIQPTPVRVGKGMKSVYPPRSQRIIASPHLLTISPPNLERFSEKKTLDA